MKITPAYALCVLLTLGFNNFSYALPESLHICPVAEDSGKPLLQPEDIKEDTPNFMTAQRLRTSDVILLICLYERIYCPELSKDGKSFRSFWKITHRGRVVQSLRGNVPLGITFNYVERERCSPPPGRNYKIDDYTNKSIPTEVIPLHGELVYLFINQQYIKEENGSLIYEMQEPEQMRYAEFFADDIELFLRIKPAHIIEESEAVKND